MRSATEGGRALLVHRPIGALLLTGCLVAACQSVASPSETLSSGAPTASVGQGSVSPGASAAPSGQALPIALPSPDRPYDAGDVLAAMRDSRRPGGVADELETEPIAAAVAAELWTFDGSPWPAIVAGGSCGPETCTLEIAGTPEGAAGEDLYIFEIRPAASSLEGAFAELRGLPAALLTDLDAYAIARWPDAPMPGPLASGRWLPPPEFGRFVLSYRSGGEEGSPAVNAAVDLEAETVDLRVPG